jgi:hypothetical protein
VPLIRVIREEGMLGGGPAKRKAYLVLVSALCHL